MKRSKLKLGALNFNESLEVQVVNFVQPFRRPKPLVIARIIAFIMATGLTIAGQTQREGNGQLNTIIDGLQKKYGALRGLAADFTQDYQEPNGRSFHESGHLIIKRPDRMRWEYAQPEKKLFVSDGHKLYFYIQDDKQVTVSSIKDSADPRTPFLFLLRRSNLRREFASITYSTESPIFAGDQCLAMIPRQAPAGLQRLVVEVNPTNFQIRRVSSFDENGTRQDFTFTDIHDNYVAPDSIFQFAIPPGVQVVNG